MVIKILPLIAKRGLDSFLFKPCAMTLLIYNLFISEGIKMSRYSKETLHRLRNQIPITDLIVHVLGIPAKTRDGYLRFLCPLCSEFLTACHPRTNLARCFRCQKNFNPIDLTMVVKGLNFREAVEFLLQTENSFQEVGGNAR